MQQSDVKPHNSKENADIHHLGFTVLKHVPYNPDIAQRVFNVLPEKEEKLKGCYFLSDDSGMAVVLSLN